MRYFTIRFALTQASFHFVILSAVPPEIPLGCTSCFWCVAQKFDKLRMTPCGVGGTKSKSARSKDQMERSDIWDLSPCAKHLQAYHIFISLVAHVTSLRTHLRKCFSKDFFSAGVNPRPTDGYLVRYLSNCINFVVLPTCFFVPSSYHI